MRNLLITAAVAALVSAAPAFAGNTKATEVNASLPATCSIIEQSASLTLGAVGEAVPGSFQYTCNFIGSPALTFSSANGGVYNPENGKSTKKYGIYLNDAAPSVSPSSWLQSSATPQAYPSPDTGNITTSNPANVTVSPHFEVALTEALDVAGTYTDTLTISIAP
jgi:hypothetical protein